MAWFLKYYKEIGIRRDRKDESMVLFLLPTEFLGPGVVLGLDERSIKQALEIAGFVWGNIKRGSFGEEFSDAKIVWLDDSLKLSDDEALARDPFKGPKNLMRDADCETAASQAEVDPVHRPDPTAEGQT